MNMFYMCNVIMCIAHFFHNYLYTGKLPVDVIYMLLDELQKKGEWKAFSLITNLSLKTYAYQIVVLVVWYGNSYVCSDMSHQYFVQMINASDCRMILIWFEHQLLFC